MTKVRLNLFLSTELYHELRAIASTSGVGMADIVRQSIALLKVAVEGKRKGLHLGIVNDVTKLDRELVGLL